MWFNFTSPYVSSYFITFWSERVSYCMSTGSLTLPMASRRKSTRALRARTGHLSRWAKQKQLTSDHSEVSVSWDVAFDLCMICICLSGPDGSIRSVCGHKLLRQEHQPLWLLHWRMCGHHVWTLWWDPPDEFISLMWIIMALHNQSFGFNSYKLVFLSFRDCNRDEVY